jgi:hypothetical protein
VLANGRCDVLRGQVVRSHAGLYYESYPEFAETLRSIETNPSLRTMLGRQGETFYLNNYTWNIVERKYLDVLNRLAEDDRSGKTGHDLEPLPGWFARRRPTLPPSNDVVSGLPSGPAIAAELAAAASR